MVMGMQTIAQQARRRADQILNDYPIDYYDKFPERIAQVKAEDVREVMKQYVADNKMTFVTVAPAAEVQKQLEKLGTVEVVPMPLTAMRRPATQPATQPAAAQTAP
jgi:Zn-dependent M16 (insulinase) family peptidase